MEQENNKMNLPERDSPAYPLAGGPQMTIDESCQQLGQYLEDILRGAGQARLNVDRLSHPCRPLGNALASFQETFQAMTRQLQEREEQLKREIQLARRRAEIIEGYTEMLVELLSQRDEWLLVIDRETREIVHCNKGAHGSAESNVYCDSCQHRLPIQSMLLEWDDSERYRVWEQEEESKHRCYRIISFPIEWKERPSCVHIVMDVTAEKMNARHLSDDVYQDMDTGVRNHLFLQEFMGLVLQERLDITLCYLDLEGVAEINNTHGRKVGDAYIQNFVEIVRKHFRSSDTFVRIEDDHFCLMLTGNVKHLIERKMDEILATFQRDDSKVFGHRCSFQYSILEVEGASNTLSLDDLLQQAEEDIQRKKRQQQRQQRQQQRQQRVPFGCEDF